MIIFVFFALFCCLHWILSPLRSHSMFHFVRCCCCDSFQFFAGLTRRDEPALSRMSSFIREISQIRTENTREENRNINNLQMKSQYGGTCKVQK